MKILSKWIEDWIAIMFVEDTLNLYIYIAQDILVFRSYEQFIVKIIELSNA